MTPGTFFFVVGASGVGKDTLIAAAMAILAPGGRYVQARRVITRPAGPGEDHEPVSEAEFFRRAEAGGFLHVWEAHGLHYGLPARLRADLAAGRHVIANGSRASVPGLAGRVDRLVLVEITAPPERLRDRILQRGRESGDQVEERLLREVGRFPAGLRRVTVANDASIEEGASRLVAVLEREAGRQEAMIACEP